MLTYESQLIANANISSFNMYANSKLHSRSAVGPVSDNNGSLITESCSKASILQQTVANNFIPDSGILPKVTSRMQSSNSLNHIYFAPALICGGIKRLKLKAKRWP